MKVQEEYELINYLKKRLVAVMLQAVTAKQSTELGGHTVVCCRFSCSNKHSKNTINMACVRTADDDLGTR